MSDDGVCEIEDMVRNEGCYRGGEEPGGEQE